MSAAKTTTFIIAHCVLFYLQQVHADYNDQCYLCYAENISAKYCMYGMDSSLGKCCLPESGEDCLRDQYYCSDKIPTTFSNHKYAFCSYSPTKCGNSQRTIFAKQNNQTIMTSLDFKFYDVCPYFIYSDTDLPFNTNVQLTIDRSINCEVYLLIGTNVDILNSQ